MEYLSNRNTEFLSNYTGIIHPTEMPNFHTLTGFLCHLTSAIPSNDPIFMLELIF